MKQDGFIPWNWGVKVKTKFNPRHSAKGYVGTHKFKNEIGVRRKEEFNVLWCEDIIGKEGWYWFSIHFKEPLTGPFETSYMAYHDAIEQKPEISMR